MGTLYGPASALPKYLTTDLRCPGNRNHRCGGRLKTWYEGAKNRTVWECSRCGDRNIAAGKADDPRRTRMPAIPKGGKKRDRQRKAVYDWELSIIGPMPTMLLGEIGQLTIEQCQQIVDTVWADYGLTDPPIVKAARKGAMRATGMRAKIVLPGWTRTAFIVLHEVTHSLQEVEEIWPDGKADQAWHGPTFATLALDLYSRYLGMDRDGAKKKGVHQKPRRVRFAPLALVPHPLRKTKKLEWRIE